GTQFRVIMASGQQAPGTSEGDEFFNLSISHDDSPRINNQGAVLFPARLTGEGIDASNDGTYYLHNGHSSTLIAREGDQAAGQNPGIFYGGFVNRDLNLSDQGQVVFNAQLTGVGVNEV